MFLSSKYRQRLTDIENAGAMYRAIGGQKLSRIFDLSSHMDLNIQKDHLTPESFLTYAVVREAPACVRLLRALGADKDLPDAFDNTAVMLVEEKQDQISQAKYILAAVEDALMTKPCAELKTNAPIDRLERTLIKAVKKKNATIVGLLRQMGVRADVSHDGGQTAIEILQGKKIALKKREELVADLAAALDFPTQVKPFTPRPLYNHA